MGTPEQHAESKRKEINGRTFADGVVGRMNDSLEQAGLPQEGAQRRARSGKECRRGEERGSQSTDGGGLEKEFRRTAVRGKGASRVSV